MLEWHEKELLDTLNMAQNEFNKLASECNEAEVQAFNIAITNAKNIVTARACRRENPRYWEVVS